MTRRAAWLLAIRPRTLVAGVVPVAVGSAVAFAAGGFRPLAALAALAGALAIQVGTNLVNDLADFERGADGADRVGPTRAVAAGLLGTREVRAGAALAFAAATLPGVYLVAVAGWPVVAIGVLSILAGIAYTAGPWPLGYHGLGDVAVLAFFGFFAVGGTAFVQLGRVPSLAVGAALPVGMLATAVLVVNNVRDLETDRRAGKRTLAVRLGRRASLVEYGGLLVGAHAVPVALALLGLASPAVFATMITLPWAALLTIRIVRRGARDLDEVLGSTARLLAAHGLLLAVGLAAG